MKFEDQATIDERIWEKVRKIRETKGREYATEEDTLADFKEVAEEVGISPLQVWAVYVKKHQRAVDSYIRAGGITLSESIDNRVLDVIVYHLLLLGLKQDLQEDLRLGPVRRAGIEEEMAP